MFKTPRRGRQARYSENSRSQIGFRTDFSENLPDVGWPWIYFLRLIRVLAYVERHPYLGVTQDANLRWNHHRHELSSKATKTLNLNKRIFWFCGEDTKCLLYKTLVRPKLEHAPVVWDPQYLSDVNKLENFHVVRSALQYSACRI